MTRRESHPVVVEPRREIVESIDASRTHIVTVAEAVATVPGISTLAPAGSSAGDVLVAGPDGVFRPRTAAALFAEHRRGDPVHLHTTTPTAPPPGARAGEWVIVIDGPDAGHVFRVEEGPQP